MLRAALPKEGGCQNCASWPLPAFRRGDARAAAQWAALHGPSIGCRSLDVLHVTLAKKLKANVFLTFDARQKSLAIALGLAVKP